MTVPIVQRALEVRVAELEAVIQEQLREADGWVGDLSMLRNRVVRRMANALSASTTPEEP